jgi:hypothetical protein
MEIGKGLIAVLQTYDGRSGILREIEKHDIENHKQFTHLLITHHDTETVLPK